jgi:2-desacetyl-2-hydroxyethyl bacteriochlorophyllide A dehydrogenase
MRAIVFQGKDKPLAVQNVADPTPEAGQVVLKVGRCGICGSDLHMAQGHTFSFDDGAVPGHEVSGEIVALGSGVQRLKMGDRVAALPFISCGKCSACLAGEPTGCPQQRLMGTFGVKGGYAEYVVVNEIWCVKLPKSLSFDDGALVEPLAVSLRANRVSGIQSGDRVLVMGAGAIGLAAAFWARRSGAARVAVSATSKRREQMALAMGADAFITPEQGRTLAEQSVAALGGEADIVFECAGMPGSLDLAISAVRKRGTVAAPGFCWTPDPFASVWAMVKEATIRYTNVYNTREYEIAVGALESGHVEPRAMITDVVGLDAAPAAFEGLMKHSNQCKVMISPW